MEHKGTIRIETDRLVLKRHVLDDAEIMFKNWVTEKDVTKFLSWQPHKNVDETKQLLIDWIESYDKQDFYFWTIELKDSHELVGDISVVSLDEATESVELGYGIGSRWWGKGITAEAGRALVKFFFEEVKVKRVYAKHVLLRKHMEEMRINDIADARVVEATRTDLKKLYSDIEISVNNKEFAYILDGHEKFNNTDLPKDVQDFLEEIYNDEDLKDAFFDCDIEIYDEAWVKDLEEDDSWFEDLMGSGESSYKNIKPFARDGLGGLWVVLDDEMIGYIGTEGECGILARNINEFMNIVAVQRGYIDDFCNADILKSVDAFIEEYEEPRDSDYNREFNRFIKKHGFTKDLKKIYEYIIKGVTIKPFFQVVATDDEYEDSYSILGSDDGQEALKSLIEMLE